MTSSWIDQARTRISRWLAAGLGPCWVVAVSGGSDSVGLLRVLHSLSPALGLRLSVAHLDHGTRGDWGREDAEFVAALAEELGLPFDRGLWAPTRPAHFESDARRARYEWLAGIARARGADAVAVGHTRDDQAETILHRIVRGTGPRGLAGMAERRPLVDSVTLARPLLTVSRQEVRAYLAEIGQPFRDDATNADLSRTRARLRHDLLPRLAAEYNPRVVEALVRLGELAESAERGLRARRLAMARDATIWADGDSIVLKGPVVRRFSPFDRAEVVREMWRRVGWPEAGMGAKHWRRIARLARSDGAGTAVVGGVEMESDSYRFILRRPDPSCAVLGPPSSIPPSSAVLPIPGAVVWPGGRVVATLDPDEPRDETIDLDCLVPPLTVRAPAAGDRFEPLGMAGRSRPLNDFFRGRRVARADRPRVPLVCDEAGIVWVVGHRIADRVRLTDATNRRVGLGWINE